ncbi:TPA: VWA domain-containing protein [Vibrio cholerae]|uniref:vWA domain-containing protein n=1 Tax=Vibrio cholerae TaxID=666 RepID=UPI00115A6C70|nr:vWA domain-containing protein [Vibrio cholerae]EJL8256462.1 VWA domain-containing protein [Vibrio cholerae]EKF9302419.1 VWA domain-containing protein [Vibrio cholerae]ELH4197852.1 VWA domain-containing protein [Vibrio cholerae]TQQ05352.1 VWA domain-containing protein [Vibrio cholerae]TQQ11989.1 VWA domain-containing protein [Vibrio cholerae]
MKGLRIPLTLLSLSILAGCGQDETSKTTNKTQVKEEVQQVTISGLSPTQSYALRGADQSWPGTGNEKLILAKDKATANYYVIFDGSGSMEDTSCGNGERRIDVAKRAIGTFFDVLPKNSNVGLIVFDDKGAREAVSLKKNNPTLLKAVTDGAMAGGGTPLGRTLEYASEKLQEQGQKQQGYGEYNIVVLTDGQAGDEDKMIRVVNDITANTPINIHTIGFCLGDRHTLNKRGVINYQPASDAAELVRGLKSVLAESSSFTSDSFSAASSEK